MPPTSEFAAAPGLYPSRPWPFAFNEGASKAIFPQKDAFMWDMYR
jgi:hypothetical protein